MYSLIQKEFSKCRKHFYSFTLDRLLKIVKKTKKEDVKSIRTRVIKHAFKKVWKLKLIWIDYEQLIVDFFDVIFRSTDDSGYLISVFSLVSWFLYFLLQEYQ